MKNKLYKDIQVSCKNCSLDSICLPRGLTQSEIDSISEVVKRKRTLQRGEYIYREGDRFRGVLAVKSGTAKLVADDFHGNEHILNILLPGELLGFDGLYNNRHNCSAIALETMSFCELPADKLESLCQNVPGLMRELFRHTGEKINDDRDQIVLNSRPAEERLASFLISLSDRLKKRGFSSTEFTLTLTRQEIGNHLSLALETISRLLKQFQNAGLITVDNRRIRIIDLAGLRKLFTETA
ncbi:MAG: helix-turn-helix domain-containing protein [Gammaproteobacteria bacterium]